MFVQTKTLLETQTATVTDSFTSVQTATVTDTMTDFMTVTQISTVVQPTTFVSVYVSTDIVDEVCLFFCLLWQS